MEYWLFAIATQSYLTTVFELPSLQLRRKDTLFTTAEKKNVHFSPYVGYNGSRGFFGGAALSSRIGVKIVDKFSLKASGSASSAVVDASLTSSRASSSPLFDYLEWRIGYQYANISSGNLKLTESTWMGQIFGATRPVSARNLIFRYGASVEGGNRITNLPQDVLPSSYLARAGYGAVKLYTGSSAMWKGHGVKFSYGLQLGNTGQGVQINYLKHLVDLAYSGRFLPSEHKPLQVDVQVSAGSLHPLSGDVPAGERFFGGNAERTFVQGDAWHIRSNPFIRSIAQNRLNGSVPGAPIGGNGFVATNLTISQPIWHRPLMPKEIVHEANISVALGGQLRTTRQVLKEEFVRKSEELRSLKGRMDSLLSPLDQLEDALMELQVTHPPSKVSQAITLFFEPDSLISTIKATVSAAVLESDAFNGIMNQPGEVAQFLSNPVMEQASLLIEDDPDTEQKAKLSRLQENLAGLRSALDSVGLASVAQELSRTANKLQEIRAGIQVSFSAVAFIRSYKPADIEALAKILNQPSRQSGRSIMQISKSVRQLLEPVLTSTQQALDSTRKELTQLSSSQDESTHRKRQDLTEFMQMYSDFLLILNEVDTYAAKTIDRLESTQDKIESRLFDEAKYNMESIALGFGGGVPSYLGGITNGIQSLEKPFAQRRLTPRWDTLHNDAKELLEIQKELKSKIRKTDVPIAEKQANQTVAYVGRVLNVLFRELNLAAISPFLMFDAARLRTSEKPIWNGFRYGVGAGIRFSLVNFNIYTGYSINLNRQFGEGPGALVLAMDLTDLFQ